MVATNVVRALEHLGLSSYEARAYAALLKSGSVTGYQLSRLSGVPRSRIYEALEKLASRGMAMTRNERPVLYAAADWQKVLDRRATELEESLKAARVSCAAVTRQAELEGVWNISGRANILAKIDGMLRAARRTASLVGSAADFSGLEPVLGEVHRRGVSVRIVVCGSFRPDVGEVYQHSFASSPCDHLAVIVDSTEALVGQTIPEESASAGWSREAGFVRVTGEYVVHEVFIARMLERLEPSAMEPLAELYRQIVEEGR